MITEKQLLKWGFEKRSNYLFFQINHDLLQGIPNEFVFYYPVHETLQIEAILGRVEFQPCTTKRKADQALHLLGLPSIDKLKNLECYGQK